MNPLELVKNAAKKSKVFDVFKINIGGEDVVITKNPSRDDLYEMAKSFRREHPNAKDTPYVRHTIDADENEYVWDSYKAIHSDIEPKIDMLFNTRTHQNGPTYFDIKYPELSPRFKGLVGAGALGATLAPQQAQAENWRNYQNKEPALQEPIIDPTTLLAGPARWGGGLANLVANTGLNAIMGKLR